MIIMISDLLGVQCQNPGSASIHGVSISRSIVHSWRVAREYTSQYHGRESFHPGK